MEITEDQYAGIKNLFPGHAIDTFSSDGALTIKVWSSEDDD